MSDEDLRAAHAARDRFGEDLLAHPDVHGVGVGLRRRSGEKTAEYAVVVHVRRKLAEGEIAPGRLVPRELRLAAADRSVQVVRTDVQEHAPPIPERGTPAAGIDVRSRLRPVPGGMSAGFSGTLGAWVWDPVTEQAVALSNRHVLGSDAGIAILQPSADDGGTDPADRIATVLRSGSLDAAIAAPTDPSVVSGSIAGSTLTAFDIAHAAIGMRVRKTGRTTGLTHGVVDLVDYASAHEGASADVWIDGDGADFSGPGDSGAVYLDAATHAIVGLHWGGSGSDGVGHPIHAVFADLGVTALGARVAGHRVAATGQPGEGVVARASGRPGP